jgi:ABC-type Fe3+/spermidine/putrescine transport system ATPase subunit
VPAHQRNLGVVFQNYALFPHMTVLQNVMYPLKLRRVPAARAREMAAAVLSQVRLQGFEGRNPRQLSGGQQQRVALARALASDPRALLLDEPFAAVDAPVREQLRRDLLALMESRELPAVVVTHDFDEAHMLGETIVVLVGGRVVQSGAPADVARHPRTAAVARLVGAGNVLSGSLAGREGATGLFRAGPFLVRAPLPPGADTRVQLCVRPDQVRLAPVSVGPAAGRGGAAFAPARATRVFVRRGGATVLLTAAGLELEAWVIGSAPAPGDAVQVSIPDGAAHVLEPEDEPPAAASAV